MKKKVLAALLASAAAFSLAGCKSSDTLEIPVEMEAGAEAGEQTADDAESGGGEDGSREAEPEALQEEALTATITVWGPEEDQQADKGSWLPSMCRQFAAKHPNWELTFVYGTCAEGEAKDNVTQDVEAAADVYMLANDNIPELVAAGGLAELEGSYLEKVTSANAASIVASVTYNDVVWAFPFTSNTWFMYYDTSVFSQDDIKSFDAMLEKGVVSFPLSDAWYIQAFYVANGCTIFGDGTDEAAGIDFGGKKGVEATKYLVDLAADPNFVNDADGAGIAGLRDGSVHAVFSGTWDAVAVEEALGGNMGVAALPAVNINGTEGQLKAFMGSKAVGVNPCSENLEVSMALAAYLVSEEAQMAHYELRKILPTNTSIMLTNAPIATAVIRVMTDTSITQPVVSSMSNYWTPAENMGKALAAGEITYDNAAEKTEEMNAAMNTPVNTEVDPEDGQQ